MNILKQLYAWVIIAILALTLLIFDPWFVPIGFGKTIVFRIILSITLVLFAYQITNKDEKIKSIAEKIKSVSLSFWLFVAIFLSFFFSTLFSPDINLSLWGDPSRSGGFVNYAFYMFLAVFTFLAIRKQDWQKIFNGSLVIGVIVGAIALIQQFGLFSKYFISFLYRPVSTLGNPIFVAIYLSLLTFVALFLLLKENNRYKKAFYSFCLIFFVLLIIFSTQTRAAYLGLIVSGLWFFFSYPFRNKNIKKYSIAVLLIIFVSLFGLKGYMDKNPSTYNYLPSTMSRALDRALGMFEGAKVMESRNSAWQVSADALKARPIFGYGLENFSIAFDKYYNPTLTNIGAMGINADQTEWWDRAHNFLLDISIAYGIPALLIYLAFFFTLIWQLQKSKTKKPENILTFIGLQSAFIGYLIANIFSFDVFDVDIILFILIGYSFYLIAEANEKQISEKQSNKISKIENFLYRNKYVCSFIPVIIAVWFVYSFNLTPLVVNKELNTAYTAKEGRHSCTEAVKILDSVNNKSSNIIDNFIRTASTNMYVECSETESNALTKVALVEKSKALMTKNAEASPKHLANWLLLGEVTNILIERKTSVDENFYKSAEIKTLYEQANNAFSMSAKLSPNRQEIYKEWLKLGLSTGDYVLAEEKAQKCIDLNKNFSGCYWLMALTQGYLKNTSEFDRYSNLAKNLGLDLEAEEILSQQANMYIRTKDYNKLAVVYEKIITLKKDVNEKAQLLASLASVYKDLGDNKKAKETALRILEIMPGAKASVDEFIKSLK